MLRRSVVVPLVVCALWHAAPLSAQRLRLILFTSDSSSFHVGSTLVLGPTEAILVDAQYHMSDARREADSIAALGTHLKAIFITHADEDHYLGAAAFIQRFPGTPVYMTPRAMWEFRLTSESFLTRQQRNEPAEAPDSLLRPQRLPGLVLTVDGERVEIVPDLQGDVLAPSNSAVWIPSLGAVLAGDIVFNRVHPWLAASDTAARRQWRQSIQRLAALRPRVVIAGHKRSLDTPDAPDVLGAMDRYLADFDEALRAAPDVNAVIATMTQKYPGYAVGRLLQASARTAWFLWGR